VYKAIPLALALLAPPALSAQQVVLRIAPPEGQVSLYHIETHTAIDMTQGSMDAAAVMRMTATVTAATDTERTIRTVVDSFTINAPGIPMPAMPNIVGSATTIRMTTRGRVLETTYSDPALTQAFGGMAGPQGSSFQAGMTLPEGPVSPGHEWSDSSTISTDGGQIGTVTVVTHTHYTFEGLSRRAGARIATIGITGTVTQSNAMMTSEGTMRGTMEFDLDAGRWITNQMTVEMQMNAGGEDATMTITTDGRLVS